MKISILLPYKENFTPLYPGAVSLFVNDTVKISKYKKNITVFGNTNYKKKFNLKYKNIILPKLRFGSQSKKYVEEFCKIENNRNSNLIEIHNRPNYLPLLIKDLYKRNYALYFHNDPLTMTGSKSISDRKYLLKNCYKILFNSNWSKKRFLQGLHNKFVNSEKLLVVYQSSSRQKISFSKKEKTITFVGKLNRSKGYDLFGSAIIKILNKYENWKAYVIGDEQRDKLSFNHKNLKILGFINHNKVINIYKKTSIAVVCSRWEEPFGRTSLEASSRGCAVIISNRGGLPETITNGIILRELKSSDLFKAIDRLIRNKKELVFLQNESIKNFYLTDNYISKKIDDYRKEITQINDFFVKKGLSKKIKILHVTNFNERHNGRLHYNTGRRINNGFIRLGHNVLSISDRDIISSAKKLNDISGVKSLNNKIINTFMNFQPDIIILGHADSVQKNTLEYLKNEKKDLKLSQWFLDPVSQFGPDFLKNKSRILDKSKILDTNFLTTDPNSLSFNIKNSFFMPNPCDHSFEVLENYNRNSENDIFFAMSHGVHRGQLKRGKVDDREVFLNKLIEKNKDIKFDIYGMKNIQPIWGSEFIQRISNSNMGLNLSRGRPIKYYSSDRIAQLLGNGLLTFIDEKTQFRNFFKPNEVVFYHDLSDLSEKIHKYKKNIFERKKIARNGKKMYFKYFNSTIVADFILSKTFLYTSKNKFLWDK